MPICASCGHESPEGNRFCGLCGVPLAVPVRSERKVVTSLFCDLVGFTAASEVCDPEEVDRVLAEYFRLARAQIEGHGGVVEKFIGDAVVGVFGVPAAREDDPERAVRAGLRICDESAALEGLGSGRLELRVGVNTGSAFVRLGVTPATGEGFLTGDAVNTAARLQSAAPVGGVAVGLMTWEATRRVFDYEELEPVELKGKSEPVRVFRPLAPRARLGVDLTRAHDAPFVGRRDEIDELMAAFDRMVANRSVELVTVIGEPGLGKSRLVHELSGHVDRRLDLYRWRQGRCLPYGEGIAFWALGEIVKAHAGIPESDPPEVARAKLEQVLPDAEEKPWLRDRLLPLLGIEADSEAEPDELFTAWRRFLEQIAAERPTVLVVEDLHWAGSGMLAFLDHLADNAGGVPLLIVSTTRPELYDRYPDHGRGVARVRLAPLSESETGQLVQGLLETTELPAELREAVLERADGNPLFAQEFVGLLRDRGLLVRNGRGWDLTEDAEVPLPDSVQAVIAARLDVLDPDHKSLLGDAAVIGKVFWAGALAAMGDRGDGEVASILAGICERGLVSAAAGSSMAGEDEYAFGHALVRDVAYDQLPHASRANRHPAAAAWIEAKLADRVEDAADVLAHHYATALELTREPERAKELQAPAQRFLVLAGERALGLDTRAALTYFERALPLAPSGHSEHPRTLKGFGEAAFHAGRRTDAIAALEEAMDAFEGAGDPHGTARAAITLSGLLSLDGGVKRLDHLQRALGLLEPLPRSAELVNVLAEIADEEALQGRPEAGIPHADRALALAEELGLGRHAPALGYRALCRYKLLGDDACLEEYREAIALATDGGLAHTACHHWLNYALALARFEGPAAALEAYTAGIAYARARGITSWVLFGTWFSAYEYANLGNEEHANELFDSVAKRAEQGGPRRLLIYARAREIRQLLILDQPELIDRKRLDWLEAQADGLTPNMALACLMPALDARTTLGQTDAAAVVLTRIVELPTDPGRVVTLPPVVRTAVRIGRPDLGELLTQRYENLRLDNPVARRSLTDARAQLAEAAGDYQAALGGYAAVVEDLTSSVEPDAARSLLLGQGRCLLALGRREEAAVVLREARGIYARRNEPRNLAETDALLEQAGAMSSR